MEVEVRAYSGLEKYLGVGFGQPLKVELPEGATVRDLITRLGIPEKEFFSALVNGRHRGLDDPLYAGERVALFPPVGGG